MMSSPLDTSEEMIAVSPVNNKRTPVQNNSCNSNGQESNFRFSSPIRGASLACRLFSSSSNQHGTINGDEREPASGDISGNDNDATFQIMSPSSVDNNTVENSFTQPPALRRNEPTMMNPEEEEEEDEETPLAGHVSERRQETEQERRQREEEESIALAQQMMAEEAMASYRMSADFLRMNSDQFSEEDFAALQNALQEEEYEANEEAVAEAEDEEGNLSYDALLRLGEQIGDVKTDRWTMISDREIAKLETFQYVQEKVDAMNKEEIDDSELKCLVCQYNYEEGEDLRRLPCGHCFHKECVDQWLKHKDVCVYCRQSICGDNEDKDHKCTE